MQDAPHENGAHCALVVGAALALTTLAPVALYQTGVIGHLPDPPGRYFDSDLITSSKDAHPFGVPDALLGLGSFGATLALALLAPRSRIARGLLGVKLAGDGGMAGVNVVKQVVKFHRLCSWCTGTALAAGLACTAGRRYLKQSR